MHNSNAIRRKMNERRELEEIIQNMILRQAQDACKASSWRGHSEPRFVRVAKAIGDTASLRLSTTNAGMVEFYLTPGSFVSIFKKEGRDLHKNRYTVEDFADPKFKPQKIIDIIIECMKILCEVEEEYQKLNQMCYNALVGAMAEFDKIMEKK